MAIKTSHIICKSKPGWGEYINFKGGANYFLTLGTTEQGNGAASTGDVTATTAAGYLKINYNGTDKYIQLYAGA